MARRKDHTHDEIRAMAIQAAGEIIERDGPEGLKIRPLAKAIGYVPGTIYNVFDGFDELLMRVNIETIDGLLVYLREAENQSPPPTLQQLLIVYGGYALQNTNRWKAVLDYTIAEPENAPDWYVEKARAGMAFIERAVARQAEGNPEVDPVAVAGVIWAGLQGIFALEADGNLKLVSPVSANQLAFLLVQLVSDAIRPDAAS